MSCARRSIASRFVPTFVSSRSVARVSATNRPAGAHLVDLGGGAQFDHRKSSRRIHSPVGAGRRRSQRTRGPLRPGARSIAVCGSGASSSPGCSQRLSCCRCGCSSAGASSAAAAGRSSGCCSSRCRRCSIGELLIALLVRARASVRQARAVSWRDVGGNRGLARPDDRRRVLPERVRVGPGRRHRRLPRGVLARRCGSSGGNRPRRCAGRWIRICSPGMPRQVPLPRRRPRLPDRPRPCAVRSSSIAETPVPETPRRADPPVLAQPRHPWQNGSFVP